MLLIALSIDASSNSPRSSPLDGWPFLLLVGFRSKLREATCLALEVQMTPKASAPC